MNKNYLDIMIQSLKKKEALLEQIIKESKRQQELLRDPEVTADSFRESVDVKAADIEALDQLDGGFDRLYQQLKGELEANREMYRDEILQMQSLIKSIMEKSNEIQTQEQRNRELAVQKFSTVRKQVREVRTSQKVVNQYYKNMMKMNYVDSQFLDSKK